MLEKLDNVLHANDDILFYNEDFAKVKFTANQRHIFAVDLDKINLDHNNNLYEDDLHTIFHVRLLALHYKFGKRKAFNSSETV